VESKLERRARSFEDSLGLDARLLYRNYKIQCGEMLNWNTLTTKARGK
jgi:hypothetical protein